MSKTYSNKFRSFGGRELQMDVIEYNPDSFEIQITNNDFEKERNFRLKLIAALVLIYSAYTASIRSSICVIDVLCLLTLFFLLYTMTELVQSEKVLFISEFALQLTTERLFSCRSSSFIPARNIKDVVINEVIDELAIKYALLVRTKGNICHMRPIIMMFRALHPRIDCLEIIYSHFLRKLDPLR